MCTSPVKIINKYLYKHGGSSYNLLPCGMCDECIRDKSISYEVRALSMYQELEPKGYSFWFVTLTFNEHHIPRANLYKSIDIDGERIWRLHSHRPIRCFDHSLLHTFTKSIKQYYRRQGKEFHYLITSEFGDEKHRPHYHAMLCIPDQFSSWRSFQKFLCKFWHYGFVQNSQIKCVDGTQSNRKWYNAIGYVVKYASKFSSAWLPAYVKYPDLFTLDIPICNFIPRVFTSNGFGKPLESRLRQENYDNNTVTFNLGHKLEVYPLPYYYRRKYYTKQVVSGSQLVLEIKYHPSLSSFPEKESIFRKKMFTETIYLHDCLKKRATNFAKTMENLIFALYNDRTSAYVPTENFLSASSRLCASDYLSLFMCCNYLPSDRFHNCCCCLPSTWGCDERIDSDFMIISDELERYRIFLFAGRKALNDYRKNVQKQWYARHQVCKNWYRKKK